jgi:hypothetical protein
VDAPAKLSISELLPLDEKQPQIQNDLNPKQIKREQLLKI